MILKSFRRSEVKTVAALTRNIGVFAILALLGSVASYANPVSHTVMLDERMFGNLNQKDVPSCVPAPATDEFGFGCGPTAVVNSFVFLEKRYPTIYGGKLITSQQKPPADFNHDGKVDMYDDMAALAELLASPDFMNTVLQTSTFKYALMAGKEKYLEQKTPKATVFEGQDSPTSTEVPPPRFPKPGYVKREDPTWQFLEENLKAGEDIELLVQRFNPDGTAAVSHYVTLTNLKWIDQDMDGVIDQDENATIGSVNPAGGVFMERPVYQKQPGGSLFTTSKSKQEFQITVAVKESPKDKSPTPSQPKGQSTAGSSGQSLSFDATSGLLSLSAFELSSAYITERFRSLDIDTIDAIFADDPILGATVSFNPFQFGGQIGDGQFLFFHPIGVGNTLTVMTGSDILFTASITSMIYDSSLETPFYARLYDFEFNEAISSAFLDELRERLMDTFELPFDLFIDPDGDFLALTNGFEGSVATPAVAGIAQNGVPVPEPAAITLLLIAGLALCCVRAER